MDRCGVFPEENAAVLTVLHSVSVEERNTFVH